MGLFVGGSQSKGDGSNDQAKEALLHRMKDEIQKEEEVMKSLEVKCNQLHDFKIKSELDHKKVLHELSDDTTLIKKLEAELHTVRLRAEKAKKETERIEAEMRENEKKFLEESRELLRIQTELKQMKKKLQDQAHSH